MWHPTVCVQRYLSARQQEEHRSGTFHEPIRWKVLEQQTWLFWHKTCLDAAVLSSRRSSWVSWHVRAIPRAVKRSLWLKRRVLSVRSQTGVLDYQTDHSAVAICVHALSYSATDQMSLLHKWHHLHIFFRTELKWQHSTSQHTWHSPLWPVVLCDGMMGHSTARLSTSICSLFELCSLLGI